MTRFVRCMVGVCVLVALTQSGCASWANTQRATVGFNYPHSQGETLGQSPHEHHRRIAASSAHDARALVEDLDLWYLTDRPTRLTRWHDR